MTKSVKVLLILGSTFTILAAIWGFIVAPQVEKIAQKKIIEIASTNPYASLDFSSIRLRILTGAIVMENLKVKFKDPELLKLAESVQVRTLSIHLDLLKLTTGEVAVRSVDLDEVETEVNLDSLFRSTDQPPEKIPVHQIFNFLNEVPVYGAELSKAKIKIKAPSKNMELVLSDIHLELSKRFNTIEAWLDLKNAELDLPLAKTRDLNLDMHILLNPNEIEVKKINFQSAFLEASAQGKFFDFENLLIFPKANLDFKVDSSLEELHPLLKDHPQAKNLESLLGSFSAQGQLTFIDFKRIQGRFETEFKALSWENFRFGDAKIIGRFQNDRLIISDLSAQHPSGNITLKQTEINFQNKLNFKSSLQTQNMDLKKFFHSIDLYEIPVELLAKINLPCQGTIQPLNIQCQGDAQVRDFRVKNSVRPSGTLITSAKEGEIRGKVNVTDKKVTYDAILKIQNSSAQSQGEIDYQKGFKINFASDFVELAHLSPVANLALSGKARLSGTTQGNSNTATMSMQVQSEDFIFEDYHFGQLQTQVSLRKGQLHFQDVNGRQASTKYNGHLVVDFLQETLRGEFQMPSARIQDINQIYKYHLKVPFELTGTGSASLQFSGPFDFWKMNTQVQADFKNITAAGETFDQLKVNMQGIAGEMTFSDSYLTKSRGRIAILGKILSSKDFQMQVETKNILIEDSVLFTKMSSNLFGQIDFSGAITGQYNNPYFKLRGNITNTVLEEQELDPSYFILNLNKNYFQTEFEFFGKKLYGEIQLPFNNEKTNLYRYQVTMDKWKYGEFFSLTGASYLASDYSTEISGNIDLTSIPGDLTSTKGAVRISKFQFQRGPIQLTNPVPISVDVRSGLVSVNSFALTGNQNHFTIPSQNFALNNMDWVLKAKMDLHLFHVFIPTLEDMSGPIELDLRILGTWLSPEIFGMVKLTDGSIKIRGVPHPIERIRAEAEFTKSRLNITRAQASFAGGQTSASGYIQFTGIGRAQINLKTDVKGMNLAIPEGVKTGGTASLSVTGDTFPYLFSGTYTVTSGLIERDFLTGTDRVEVKQSSYLPKNLRKDNVSPLNFDIQIHIDQPLAIRNPQAEGTLTGRLNLRGTPTNPLLLGRIEMSRETIITFRDKTFNLQNGVIEFNNPNKISPDLYISAQTRVAEYDVSLLLLGSSENPDLRLTSVPALPPADLLSLLALGVTPTTQQNVQSAEQARQTGFELGSVIFSANPLNKELKDRLGVDIQLTTSLDSTKNVNVPKLTASRRLTKKVNATASRSLSGDEAITEMKLQYLINKNVSAIGSFENRENTSATSLSDSEQQQKSIFGVDLEYRRDFK